MKEEYALKSEENGAPGMHPSAIPNWTLRAIKWPIALVSPVLLPFAVMAAVHANIYQDLLGQYIWITYGAGIYLMSWFLVFSRQFSGSYFSTFEHELTHAIFAWLSLHKVIGLTVTWNKGGACRFEGSGGGNWLIAISPYFFPTLVLIPMIAAPFVTPSYPEVIQGSYGFLIAYHLTSTWRETHPAQDDIQRTGVFFAWLFLPTANVMIYAATLIYCVQGASASWAYVTKTWSSAYTWTLALLQ